MNADGNLDLVMSAVIGYGDVAFSAVEVMLGNGDGTFTSNGFFDDFGDFTALALADVNGDGNLDVAAPGRVLLGKGDGTLEDPIPLDPSVDLWSVFADFNADGITDWVCSELVKHCGGRPPGPP